MTINNKTLESMVKQRPLKARGLIIELEQIHQDLVLLNTSPNAASYWNCKKVELLKTYGEFIPGERSLIEIYDFVNKSK